MYSVCLLFEPPHDKTNKMICAPSIRSVWSESSLSAWRNTGSSATHWEHCKNTLIRFIWVFAGHTDHYFVGFVMRRLSFFTLFLLGVITLLLVNEPPHDSLTNKMTAPSEDSDQPGHPPSLIRVFAVRMKKPWVLGYPWSAKRRLWSDWQMPRLILVFAGRTCHFVGFVARWLK